MNWEAITDMLTTSGAISTLRSDNLGTCSRPSFAPIGGDAANPMTRCFARLMCCTMLVPALVGAETGFAVAPKLSIADLVGLESESVTTSFASKFCWLYKLVVRLAIPDGRLGVLFGRASSFIHALGVVNAKTFPAAILLSVQTMGRNHHDSSANDAWLGLLGIFAHAQLYHSLTVLARLAHDRIRRSQPTLLEVTA